MRLIETQDEWAGRLARAAGAEHANEAELRHRLYAVLAPYCLEVVGLAESQLRHEGTSSSGRFDMLLGSTLIEFKSPGELNTLTKRRQHASQALRYLEDEAIGASVVLLTDGRTWGILRDPSTNGGIPTLDVDLFPATDDELFQWRPNSDATARRVLDLLDTVVFTQVTPASLMNHLGPSTAHGRALLAALATAVGERTADGRTDILFRQWLLLAGVSYGIGSDAASWPKSRGDMLGPLAAFIPDVGYAQTIFTLHTYVALCSKLIAGEALALTRGRPEQRPSQWPTLQRQAFLNIFDRLESGSLAEEMGAPRMMGGDLFGWYADAAHDGAEISSALRGLVAAFSELAWARLALATLVSSDLLRGFYTGVVPRGLRKGLGEFFTPEWIADRVVDKALTLSNKDASDVRFLDPTCGSGTFLVAAMRRAITSGSLKGLEPQDLARVAISSVTGFDVNPVSPLMARVNLLLTLGDLADQLPELQFNVFQADSILIPEEPSGQVRLDQSNAELTVPLVIGDISLPRSLATLPAVSGLARIADHSIQRGRSEHLFSERLRAEFPSMGVEPGDVAGALEAAVSIYRVLSRLHQEGRDGVWAHVIEQSFAPRVMMPVDVVVGNPPWISWKNLPLQWRDRSKSTWSQWGLWQSKTRGGGIPMSDISSLLLARCVASYCPDGLVALLLPEGVLVNEPGGRAIRRCSLGRVGGQAIQFSPVHIDDFSTLNPFPDAATRPIALYVETGKAPVFPVGGTKWNRATSRVTLPTDMSFQAARRRLVSEETAFTPVDAHDPASRWRPALPAGQFEAAGATRGPRYTWGQGFHSRGADGIFFCEVISEMPFAGGLVRIRTRPDLGRNTKHIDSVEALVEANYLWPLVRGANVQPFRVDASNLYALIPHDPSNPSKVLSVSQALSEAPRMYDYFEPHLEFLEKRSAYDMKLDKEFPWGIQGIAWRHMSRSRILVLSRYMEPNSMPPASVYQPEDDSRLGLKTTCYPNNKVNFLACDSLEEADYIAAFMNSGPARQSIARRVSSTTIAPNTLNSLALPKYDVSVRSHRDLRDLGEECRLAPHAWLTLTSELDAKVISLIETDRQAPQPS
ncbi:MULTISPECIES: N-6 DNA methylase [unclassified Frigoribacterium]|uniref:N-6 DNA methylase n=1 Tax=unclassified Frigoribacterium TaxID=2627005 RepID=UPI0012F7D9AF|nr:MULTISPECIES: N-6 DNA methylase [unclassified Frigoribacterium]